MLKSPNDSEAQRFLLQSQRHFAEILSLITLEDFSFFFSVLIFCMMIRQISNG